MNDNFIKLSNSQPAPYTVKVCAPDEHQTHGLAET
eukprot:CAMPEP_0203745988 /NCGR_PEP_ID=MMETSP0098-20131031/1564_1 /ASSEMBLY_ACC=CAM_ASM_000208 /TAXON_ID=96639 /ORGANISM=" , Strain NY0313808BC1" /LENGTH=34 /DNA_ID= /DNA_START= /DNA_END= /DNA_ORIENTATION=